MVESRNRSEVGVQAESSTRAEKLLSRMAILSLLAATVTTAHVALHEARDKAEYAIAYPVLDDTLLANGYRDVHNLNIDITNNTFSFISVAPSPVGDQLYEGDDFQNCSGRYEYVNFKLSIIFSDLVYDSEHFIVDKPEDTTIV